jgi:hypothetical protein
MVPLVKLCPIAIAVGCKKCPVFAICPVKTIIGDYRPNEHPAARKSPPPKKNRPRKRRQAR